jgi:hypothetical protein
MDASLVSKYSACCEERLWAFHRQDAYKDISQLEDLFTDEDIKLAQEILHFVRGLSVMKFNSQFKSLRVDLGVKESLHQHFQHLYTPIRIRADGNCLYHAISTGLVGDESLSTVLRFGCIGVLLQHKDYFSSNVVNEKKVFLFDDVEGTVVFGSLSDIGLSMGTLADMVFPITTISIPEKLKNIPPNTLCYGGPAQILALSILTNRVINVFGYYPLGPFENCMNKAEFMSFLNEKKTKNSYVWKRECVRKVPLSIYLRHNHFSLLMPLSDSHFS